MSTELKSLVAFKLEQAMKTMGNINAVALVAKGMELLAQYPTLNESEKKALLFQVLQTIAAGKDGVQGTSDDVIDTKTLAQLKFMLENNIVQDMVSVIEDVAAGKFKLDKAKGLISKLVMCFGAKELQK